MKAAMGGGTVVAIPFHRALVRCVAEDSAVVNLAQRRRDAKINVGG